MITQWLKFAGALYVTAAIAGCGGASSEDELTSEDSLQASATEADTLQTEDAVGTLEQGLSNVSGINLNNSKPTYGLNGSSSTTAGTCTSACSKVSSTSIAGTCCVCNGATRKFARSSYSTTTYLCQ